MRDALTIAIHDGRQLTAARALAGLTVLQLAEAAGTTTRTVNRLEVGGPILVAAKKRHGHVARDLWMRIRAALEHRGVEIVPEADGHGAGVRWSKPRSER